MRFTPGVVVHNTSVILYVFTRLEQDPWVGICIVICILELLDLTRHILHNVLFLAVLYSSYVGWKQRISFQPVRSVFSNQII